MGIYRTFFASHPDGIRALLAQLAPGWWDLLIGLASLSADVPAPRDDAWGQPDALDRLDDLLFDATRDLGIPTGCATGPVEALAACQALLTGQPGAQTHPGLDALAANIMNAHLFEDLLPSTLLDAMPFRDRLMETDTNGHVLYGPKIWRYPTATQLGLAGAAAQLWELRNERSALSDSHNGFDFSWYSLQECRVLLAALDALGPLPDLPVCWVDGAGWRPSSEVGLKIQAQLPADAIRHTRCALRRAVKRKIGLVSQNG